MELAVSKTTSQPQNHTKYPNPRVSNVIYQQLWYAGMQPAASDVLNHLYVSCIGVFVPTQSA